MAIAIEESVSQQYFDFKRDMVCSFFCQACLIGKLADEMSSDPRYCQGCCDFLTKEAEMLGGTKHPAWIPKPHKPKKAGEKQYQYESVCAEEEEVLAHTESLKSHECQNLPTEKPVLVMGGRPLLDLPEDLIRNLSDNGLGITDILKELKGQDIKVSRRTVYRILAGQRTLVKSGEK